MKQILVVDDEPRIAEICRDYLERAGFKVTIAGNGADALTLARTKQPDLVVLDLGLPKMDGLDVTRGLRKRSNVPIIMDGAATLRRVAITSRQGSRTHRFELTLFLPNNRSGAAPVFLLINNRPPSNTDPTRKEKSGFWPAEQMIARGYGIAAFHYAEIAPDDAKTYREGVIKFFDEAADRATPYTWGALAAWGWGASRAMDYFETDSRVDKRHVAVVGHSRGGKAALWAGAEDERFAMVISNDSGEGGAALSRRNFGELSFWRRGLEGAGDAPGRRCCGGRHRGH